MITSLYTADVKLNPTNKEFHKMLVVYNPEHGIVFINRGLFSISFESQEALNISDVEVKNKKHIGDINL